MKNGDNFFVFCFVFLSSLIFDGQIVWDQSKPRARTPENADTHTTHSHETKLKENMFLKRNFLLKNSNLLSLFFFVFLLSYSIVSLSCFRFQTKNYIEIKKDNQNIVHIYIRSQIHLIKEAYVGLKKKKNITQRPRTEEEEEKTLKIKNKKNQKLKEGETYHLTRTGLMYIISILRISVLPRKVVFPVGSSFQLFYVEVKSLKRPKKEKFFSCCWPDRTASGGK